MQPGVPESGQAAVPSSGAALPATAPSPAQPVPLMSAQAASSPLLLAARGWIVAQVTSPKTLGVVATAVLGLFGGKASIDYLREVWWPPALGAEAEIKSQTLEIKAWNLGARESSLRNVVVTVVEDGFATSWPTEEVDWREPAKFAEDGVVLPKDGHESEFKVVLGKAMPSASFFELGGQCTFHLEATFDRQDVRIPVKGECTCNSSCRI